jgi:GDSL-like Lipase/Acylhydrolase family
MPGRLMWRNRSHSPAAVQRKLAFATAGEKRDRAFKRAICVMTALVIVGLLVGTSAGRNAALVAASQGRALLNGLVGFPLKPWLDGQRVRAERLRNAASARQTLANTTTPGSAIEMFMRSAQMDAGSALIRWGNVNRSIVLSSAVFEPDDSRAYRLKPGVRSIWVIGLALRNALAMFLVPDTQAARDSAKLAGGVVVPESVQTTNSWGCRGPEPDLTAPVRVMVLGDSMMQGALVGDKDTPPARLEVHLSRALSARVSVLNTGHLGYSLEQYYQTFRELDGRFQPHYVMICVSQNDFADLNDPASWAEGEYWLDLIVAQCRERQRHFLIVPLADQFALLGPRNLAGFQGQFQQIVKFSGRDCIDLSPSFTDVLLDLRNQSMRHGNSTLNPLYNLHLMGDGHYSPLGADLWARVVARRLLLVWDSLVLTGRPSPEPVVVHARSARPSIPDDGFAG